MSFEFLRGAIGVIGVACAFMTGRALASIRKGWMKPSRLTAWVLRTVVCLGALLIRHPVDSVAIAVWACAAVALAAAWLATIRRKPAEDLTREIFPGEE